jgi:ABC-type polysaccharide/polyol phosphate transport system ATPase subunit
MSEPILPGEIVLDDAWRSFESRGDRGRTLKELFTSPGRRRNELPPTHALAGVSLRVRPGETLGIVGRNGAGKTSTLRVLAGIIPLQRGSVACGGRIATLIDLASGFGREFTGRENIHVSAALHGMTRVDVQAQIDRIIEFSELGHFIDAPVKTYSSGMLVRLGFSIAAHLNADVLLIDEVLAVGDEAFQRKCLRHIRSRIDEGVTVVLVSHAPGTIEAVCRRVVVLDAGRIVFDGPTADALDFYHRLLGIEDASQAAARQARQGKVWLREALLQDGEGRMRQVFAPAEPVRVVLEIATQPDPPDVSIVINVRRIGGQTVFESQLPLPTSRGGGRLVFEIPRLALLGGDYDMPLSIHEPGDAAPGIDRLLSFSVTSAEDAQGIADLRGTWTFHQAPVEISG